MFRDDPGDVTTVKHLLQEPADPNCRNPQTHKSPIVKAIWTHGFSLFLLGGGLFLPCCFVLAGGKWKWKWKGSSSRVCFLKVGLFVCGIEKNDMFMVQTLSKSGLLIA